MLAARSPRIEREHLSGVDEEYGAALDC